MGKTLRAWVTFIALFLMQCLSAQRLSTGMSLDFYGFNPTRFPSDIIFSETSYMAYRIKQFQSPSGWQLSNYGWNLWLEYHRYYLNVRGNLSSPTKEIMYSYTYPVGGDIDLTYYSRIMYQQFQFSAAAGYFLNTQRLFKPYIEAGLGRSLPYFYREDYSTIKDFSYAWFGREEIKEQTGLSHPSNFLVLSTGVKANSLAFYLRYLIRLGNHDMFYSNLSIGFSASTKFANVRKHYIYQPEE